VIPPPPETLEIITPKGGGDIVRLFANKSSSLASRLSIRKAATALDKVAIELMMKDHEIIQLQIQLEQAKPRKKCKIRQDPNEHFLSLIQVLAQTNCEPDVTA
jgi:hypothetical protein